MKKKVLKFGGSSLADASQIEKVKKIILSDDDRRYIVVSAAGKRNSADDKMTDLLISYHKERDNSNKRSEIEKKIRSRYIDIVKNLNIDFNVEKELNDIFKEEESKETVDYLASRGEYLSAKMLSMYLGAIFLDTKSLIIFNEDRKADFETSYINLRQAIERIEREACRESARAKRQSALGVHCEPVKIVIPGFYGSTEKGEIVTFSRGGSDITGAIVARAINADIYENWTDVSGVMFADPRIVKDAKPIDYITYTELRELSYMGATVLHEETIFPVSRVGIPINILNTNKPGDKGTMIVSSVPSIIKRNVVTGIAGRKGFASILLQKALMNEEIGYLSRLLKIFENEKISVEHCPTGIDTISIVLRSELLNDKKDNILQKIKEELTPDILNIEENISLIAVVGEGMVYHKDVIMKVFKALADSNIMVKMIDQGSSGINIIIGVSDSDYEKAICALGVLQNEN